MSTPAAGAFPWKLVGLGGLIAVIGLLLIASQSSVIAVLFGLGLLLFAGYWLGVGLLNWSKARRG